MITTYDTPVTDKELDGFYGREVSEYEVNKAIIAQKRAFDADDLAVIAEECAGEILTALENNAHLIGGIFQRERAKLIANRASCLVFGHKGVIKPEEV